MKRSTGHKTWIVLAIIAFIVSIAFLSLGLDKMFNYDNGESYPYEYQNAYVGGDAYNFIINGNYATGFFVLTAMFALMGVVFIAIYYLSIISTSKELLFTIKETLIAIRDNNSD